MSSNFPRLWQIVLILIGIPLSWLIVWFLIILIAHIAGFPTPPTADVSGLLSTLGGLIGAVFTVGGLVVALVAILTQIQLQDRVRQEVEKAKQAVEDTFNNELRNEYEKRIQEQVEGMLDFFQATDARQWEQAEALARRALQKNPQLTGVRSYMGLRLSSEVKLFFFSQLLPVSLGYTESPATGPLLHQARSKPPPPKLEAIHWLEDALEHNDDPDEQASEALACMYGYSEAYNKMIDILSKLDEKNRLSLHDPDSLLMLVYGCGNDIYRINELMKIIRFQLPIEQQVITSASDREPSLRDQFIDWYAIEKSSGVDTSRMTVSIRIFRTSDPSKEIYALVFKKGAQQRKIPPDDPSRIVSLGLTMLPLRTPAEIKGPPIAIESYSSSHHEKDCS